MQSTSVRLDPSANPALVIGQLLQATGLKSKEAEERLGLPKTKLSQLKKKQRLPEGLVSRMQALVDGAPAASAAAEPAPPGSTTPVVHLLAEPLVQQALSDPHGVQQRAAIDATTVDEYADALRTAGEWCFPPIIVFRTEGQNIIADGFHRLQALSRLDEPPTHVPVDHREGGLQEAILFACGANAEHGLRRTRADKRRAVLTLLQDPEWSRWSSRAIAEQAKVSHPFVERLREALAADAAEAEHLADEAQADAAGDTEPSPSEPPAVEPVNAPGNVTAQVDLPPQTKPSPSFRAIPGDDLDGVRATNRKLAVATPASEKPQGPPEQSPPETEVRRTRGGGTQTVTKKPSAPQAKKPPEPRQVVEKFSDVCLSVRDAELTKTEQYQVAQRACAAFRYALSKLDRPDQTDLLRPLLDWNNQQRQQAKEAADGAQLR
jgi:hypothetical protein